MAKAMYPDDALARAIYLTNLLATKVRELCYEPEAV
jgi:hypothetical protein